MAENLALRQQLATLLRDGRRPRLGPIVRAFWVVLSRTWSRWADVLAIVKLATVITWHRRGFARFWAYKSRQRGRPPLSSEVIELIERMTRENPMWSRRRIAAELAKLGHDVSKDTAFALKPEAWRGDVAGRLPLLKHKKALIINTTIWNERSYDDGLREAMKKLIDEYSLIFPGVQSVEHVYFYAVHGADDETRRGYLERAYALGRNVEGSESSRAAASNA